MTTAVYKPWYSTSPGSMPQAAIENISNAKCMISKCWAYYKYGSKDNQTQDPSTCNKTLQQQVKHVPNKARPNFGFGTEGVDWSTFSIYLVSTKSSHVFFGEFSVSVLWRCDRIRLGLGFSFRVWTMWVMLIQWGHSTIQYTRPCEQAASLMERNNSLIIIIVYTATLLLY